MGSNSTPAEKIPADDRSRTLFYRPRAGKIWDTWIYIHNGVFFLYYLSGPMDKRWSTIALATSDDGVHWREYGDVIQAEADVSWVGSGSVWAVEFNDEKTFIMNFSEWRGQEPEHGGRQTMFFAQSKDLISWERLEEEFTQETAWYEDNGRWDNIWTLPNPKGGFYGYWAATLKGNQAGLGFGETRDGVNWRALPPVILDGATKSPNLVLSPEIGAAHTWNGKYYLIVGLDDLNAVMNDDLSGSLRPGMTTFIGESPEGTFYPAPINRRLLVGNCAYFCRFITNGKEILVNNHSWEIAQKENSVPDEEKIYLAPLKKAIWDEEGTLRLAWWEGNDLAKESALSSTTTGSSNTIQIDSDNDADKTLIIESFLTLPESSEAPLVGLYFQGSEKHGFAYVLNKDGSVSFGPMQWGDHEIDQVGTVDRDITFPQKIAFRLVKKGRLTEFYLNDYLMQCYCLPPQCSGPILIMNPPSEELTINSWLV